jgi:chromate transporter
MTETTASSAVASRPGSVAEVFLVALRLGLTSFGGPIAHLGYFERTYVRERKWLTPDEYGGLVALCQMVPGPASSQVGYLIGLRRAGWAGAFAAWAGFTLPSALVMFAFALLAPHLEGPTTNAVLHGLKLVAVAVVAQAVWSMARNLCPDRPRAALALLAAALLLVISGSFVQIAALLIGAVGGALLCRNLPAAPELPAMPVTLRTGGLALGLFLILLVTLPLAGAVAPAQSAGAGRHLLQSRRTRIWRRPCCAAIAARCAGAAAMVIGRHLSRRLRRRPGDTGPTVHFSAYLGAVVAPAGVALLWSAVALFFIFLPGVLIALPACRYGCGLAIIPPRGPHWPGSMPRWSAFSERLCTTRSGSTPSPMAAMSQLPWLASCCSNAGGCRRSRSWFSAWARH